MHLKDLKKKAPADLVEQAEQWPWSSFALRHGTERLRARGSGLTAPIETALTGSREP